MKPHSDEIRQLAERITADLFTDGTIGPVGDQVVLLKDGDWLAAWDQNALARRIEASLREAAEIKEKTK